MPAAGDCCHDQLSVDDGEAPGEAAGIDRREVHTRITLRYGALYALEGIRMRLPLWQAMTMFVVFPSPDHALNTHAACYVGEVTQ